MESEKINKEYFLHLIIKMYLDYMRWAPIAWAPTP